MTEATENNELQRIITRQQNQIQALVSAQILTLKMLITIGPEAGFEPYEIETLRGQVNALHTLRSKQ